MVRSTGGRPGTAGWGPREWRGLGGAVLVGVAGLLGLGVFVALVPAAAAAGDLLPVSVVLAAAVAALTVPSATAVAAQAAEDSPAGNGYVDVSRRLGLPLGHLAGWASVVGRTTGSTALALGVGGYLWPEGRTAVGIVAALLVLALCLAGLTRSVRSAGVVVAAVLLVLMAVVLAMLLAPPEVLSPLPDPETHPGPVGVVRAAGLMYLGFVGASRVALLHDRVVDPARTLVRAVWISTAVTVVITLAVTLSITSTVGAEWLAARAAPVAEAAEITGWPWLGAVVRVVAAVALTGSLLALLPEMSRTVVTMARDGLLPRPLGRADRQGRPVTALLVISMSVVVLTLLLGVQDAIGVSSFCLLVGAGLVHTSALGLTRGLRRAVPAAGLVGCVVLALALPWTTVLAGVVVLFLGAFVGWFRHTTRESPGAGGDGDPADEGVAGDGTVTADGSDPDDDEEEVGGHGGAAR